jgi:PAS domain S-box-containing protein
MASNDRAHILAVVAEKAKAAAALDPSLMIEDSSSVEDAAARLSRHPRPDLIVIGSAVNAGHAGERLVGADGETPLLFMIRPDRLARFQAGLPFMPRLHRAWTAADDVAPSDLRQLMLDAVASARSRADFGNVMSRINFQLTRRSANGNPRFNQRRLSDRYFTTLLSTAPDAFLALDTHGSLIAFNDAAAELFSIGDEVGDVSLEDFISEDARGDLRSLLTRALQGELIKLAELPLLGTSGGRQRWIELSLAPIRAEATSGVSISGIAREVTERKRLEIELRYMNETLEAQVAERTAALQQSEISIRTVFETSHQNQGLLSPDGTVIYVNKTSLASIKGRLEDVVGRPYWETPWFTGTPGVPQMVKDAISRVAAGESAALSMALDMPTGRRVYDFSMRPVLNEAGAVVAMVPEAVEITARVQAEDALRQSQKMEAVGQLTGGIAHDFNNLLTVIGGNMEMVSRRLGDGVDPRVRRGIDNALNGTERASVLTQRLLAFSRRQSLDPKPLDVGKLINSISQLLARTLGETIVIETVVSAGLWRIEVDTNQLENTILNLAVNARDAMPQGGKLTLEASNSLIDRSYATVHPEVSPGNYVLIAISDTGSGMNSETQARAFDPFFTTKEVGKGTGLGLSMVYGFVKQSGGHVKIYSEVGEGTTIKIYLPRLVGGKDHDDIERPAEAELGVGDETVLVVEDDDDVRAFTVDSLRELGYRVLESHDGPSALRLLDRQEQSVHLLLTDVVMPEMSGRELADAVHARKPDLPVLYTSGYTRNAMAHAGRLGTSVELLAKPFTFAELATKVREILDGSRTTANLRS